MYMEMFALHSHAFNQSFGVISGLAVLKLMLMKPLNKTHLHNCMRIYSHRPFKTSHTVFNDNILHTSHYVGKSMFNNLYLVNKVYTSLPQYLTL